MGVWNGWGYGIAIFRAPNLKCRSLKFGKKNALSAEFQGFSWKIRALKNIFRTLENGHSIRHQSIPPLSAGRHLNENISDALSISFGGRGWGRGSQNVSEENKHELRRVFKEAFTQTLSLLTAMAQVPPFLKNNQTKSTQKSGEPHGRFGLESLFRVLIPSDRLSAPNHKSLVICNRGAQIT